MAVALPDPAPMALDNYDVRELYRGVIHAIEKHALDGGTPIGTATVVRRVFRDAGVNVDGVPLPKLTRAEEYELLDRMWARRAYRSRVR
jgi:hypothetical protein